MNHEHLALMRRLFAACEARGLPVWLESGWAVDARLGRIVREHEDVDLAIPEERLDDFHALLHTLGAGPVTPMDYGFLVHVGPVLLDCEPCVRAGDAWELDGPPPGSCPLAFEGRLEDLPVRCTSWAAIAWEYFHYLDEVPFADWPAKDRASWALVRASVGEAALAAWHAAFRAASPHA